MDWSEAPQGFDPADYSPPPLAVKTWKISSIALDLAGHCNLACRYCAEALTQPRKRGGIDKKIIDSAVALLQKNQTSIGSQSIRLGSGEPMLAIPLLKYLHQKLALSKDEWLHHVPQVFITTNGTLLDREIREWIVETGWNLKVSLDGPPMIQNYWRPTLQGNPTWDLVSDAVADLSQRIPGRFSVTSVLCRGSDPYAVYSSIVELGVKRIEFVPAIHHNESFLPNSNDIARYVEFVMDYANDFIAKEGAIPQLVRVVNACRRVMGYDLKRISCGAGRNFVAVGPGGYLYPCFRFVGLDEYCLGQIDSPFDTELFSMFQKNAGREYRLRSSCGECWAGPLCGGPCFAEAEMFGIGAGEPVDLHCHYTRADSASAVAIVEGLRKKDPELLLQLLHGIVEL